MIRAEKLSKFYGGKRALGPVSFEIEDGETVGFLGLNGAGKTTALRILACDLRPSGGTVSVGDIDALADPHQVRQRIGFLPESPPLYQDMSVADYLLFAGQLRGMDRSEIKKRLPRVLELTHIKDVKNDIIGHLSHGYRQRVGVAQAIIHNPTLLILDEPTRGLDPVQIVEMRNMIHDLKQEHTVLISSHILTEISQTCDRLLVLGRGEILAAGTETELTANITELKAIVVVVRPSGKASTPYRGAQPVDTEGSGSAGDDQEAGASAADPADPIKARLMSVEGVDKITGNDAPFEDKARSYRIDCHRDVRAEVARALIHDGHELLRLDQAHSELERTFLQLVQGGKHASN
jgi:ABC-2 type transport system ATP-binding protein